MPDAHELAKVYYSAARAEILQRLALREQVLLAGAAAFGVIGGLAFANHRENQNLLCLVPFLSLAFTVVLFRHHWLIADLGNYINRELAPPLGIGARNEVEEALLPLHWDAWLFGPMGRHVRAPRRKLRTILIIEWLGALFLLLGPGVAGFILVSDALYLRHRTIFWTDIVALACSGALFLPDAIRLFFRWK